MNLTGWCWAKHWLLCFIQTFSHMSWTIRLSNCKLSFMIFTLTFLPKYIACSSILWSKIQSFMDHAGNTLWGFIPVYLAPVSQLQCPWVLCCTDNRFFGFAFINSAIYWDFIWWSEVVDHCVFLYQHIFTDRRYGSDQDIGDAQKSLAGLISKRIYAS